MAEGQSECQGNTAGRLQNLAGFRAKWAQGQRRPALAAISSIVGDYQSDDLQHARFSGGWESWHTSALFGETPSTPTSIDDTVQALRAAGVPDAKIGIGVGFYNTMLVGARADHNEPYG